MTPEETTLYAEVLRAALYDLLTAVETKTDVEKFLDNGWRALDWSPIDDMSIDDREKLGREIDMKLAKHDITNLIQCLEKRAVNHVPVSPLRMVIALYALLKWLRNPERQYESLYPLSAEANEAMIEFHHIAYRVGVEPFDIPF